MRGWQIARLFGGGVAAVMFAASQVSVEEARSNLAGWLDFLGADRIPEFVNKPLFDTIIAVCATVYILILIGDLLLTGYGRWLRNKGRRDPHRHDQGLDHEGPYRLSRGDGDGRGYRGHSQDGRAARGAQLDNAAALSPEGNGANFT